MIFVLVIGSMVVTFLVTNSPSDAKGQGVSEMDGCNLRSSGQHLAAGGAGQIVGLSLVARRHSLRLRREDRDIGARLGAIAQRNFTVARSDDIAYALIPCIWNGGPTMTVVVTNVRAVDVLGLYRRSTSPIRSRSASRPFGA